MKRLIIILILFVSYSTCITQSKQYKYVTDIGYYFATSHESKISLNSDYLDKNNLKNIDFNIGRWKGKEVNTNDKLILFLREYESDENELLYFICVNGFNESTFHTPEICYVNDGWQILKREYRKLKIGGNEFVIRCIKVQKDYVVHNVYYWYMFKDSNRIISDGCTMFRISVQNYGNDELTELNAIEFINELIEYDKNKQDEDKPDNVMKDIFKSYQTNSKFPDEKKRAINWIISQIVPNSKVTDPAMQRRNLVLSYEIDENEKDYSYIYSKSAIYDSALAAIALTMSDDFKRAGLIIDALTRAVTNDGSLWFSYNTHNMWPDENDNEGAIIRNGAIAWVGYAITFYIRACQIFDKEILIKDNEIQRYLECAKQIADCLIKQQVLKDNDIRFGLITGGKGSYELKIDNTTKKIHEEFTNNEIKWCSVEHNIDSFYFFRDLFRITNDEKYISASKMIKKGLLKNAWNQVKGQFNRGVRIEGPDTVMALDCASWASIFLNSIGEYEKSKRCIDSANKYLSDEKRFGYKPYIDDIIYESSAINRYFYYFLLFFCTNPRI